jgi:hypothetical protein
MVMLRTSCECAARALDERAHHQLGTSMPRLTCLRELAIAIVYGHYDGAVHTFHSRHNTLDLVDRQGGPQAVATGALYVTHSGLACMVGNCCQLDT